MTKALLWPERQRCRACRSYFGFRVVLRMYCSDACAGRPESKLGAENLPRQCRAWDRERQEWKPKAAWPTEHQIKKAAKKNPNVVRYRCDGEQGCGMWHFATRREPKE